MQEVLETLINCEVLSLTIDKENEEGYQPRVDLDLINVQFILSRYETNGKSEKGDQPVEEADAILKEMDDLLKFSMVNKLLKGV